MRKAEHTYWLVFPKKRFGKITNGWQSAGEPFIFNRSLTEDNKEYLLERAKEQCPDYERLEFHNLDIKTTLTIDKD